MIDKETWKIGTDKMGKLIKYHLHVQYHKKRLHGFFLWMIPFNTHLNLIGKLKWIGKMTYNITE